MVDGAIILVDAAEGPMPQTKFVLGKALKIGLKPIVCVNKVDKPDARPTEVVNEVFDLFAALDATDEQLDFPIIYGSAKHGWMSDSPDAPKTDMAALFDQVLKHVEPPKVGAGGFRMLGTLLGEQPLPRPHRHRPRVLRLDPDQHAGQSARPRGRPCRNGPGLEDPRLPRHRARAHRRGGRRRHYRDRGAGEVQRRRHAHESGRSRAAACAADRSADAVDDVLRQRQPARRHRGRQGDEPRHSRPAFQGSGRQCRAQGRGGPQLRFLHCLGPRRIAACDPDRDDAPRGFRAWRVASEGALPQGRIRRDPGADRGSRDRRRRGAFRRRRAEDERAQGRDDRDAPVRRRPSAPRFPRADARPHRLSRRIADRHARHRDHEPPVPQLGPLEGRDRRAPQRGADLERVRAKRSPMRCGTSKTAAR